MTFYAVLKIDDVKKHRTNMLHLYIVLIRTNCYINVNSITELNVYKYIQTFDNKPNKNENCLCVAKTGGFYAKAKIFEYVESRMSFISPNTCW